MSNKQATKKYLTQPEFSTIKALQEVNLPIGQVVKVTNRSYNTVKSVFEHDTLEAHKQAIKQRGLAYKSVLLPSEAATALAPKLPVEDYELLLSKITNIETCLNTLLDIFQGREAKANVAFWKR